MKILKIAGEDYAALHFSDDFRDTPVADIIENPENYSDENSEDGSWELSVHEFECNIEDVDPKMLQWFKNQIDYDTSKHEFFFFENETIK